MPDLVIATDGWKYAWPSERGCLGRARGAGGSVAVPKIPLSACQPV